MANALLTHLLPIGSFFLHEPQKPPERFWGSRIILATGRYPPPPRAVGQSEAQLTITSVAPHFFGFKACQIRRRSVCPSSGMRRRTRHVPVADGFLAAAPLHQFGCGFERAPLRVAAAPPARHFAR